MLEAAGAAADRIVLVHLDRNPDLELHAEIVSRGVNLVYDTIGRIKYRHDSGAALFLLSDEARMITGQVLAVDGGRSVSEG